MAEFQVVTENINGVLYPPDLPKDRGYGAQKCASICISGLLGIAAMYVADKVDSFADIVTFIGISTTNCISTFFVFHSCLKTFTLVEEYSHLHARHNDNVIDLVKKAYSFNGNSYALGAISFLVTHWSWHLNGWDYMWKYGNLPVLYVCAASFFIQWLVKMEWSSLQDSILVEAMNGMDYGSGMAYSFFYGFLHIVLPVTGDANKGIRERIDDYIAREGLTDDQFPVKKLFILIPASTFISCTLDELASGWMKTANSLEEQQFDVAGVRARSYKNAVYKIRDPYSTDKHIYVVAEGATPLKTLNDVVVRSITKSGYREHKKEIIHMFHKTLRKILRADERTKNNCELIYYVDKDKHGDNVNIGKLILERIQKLEREQLIKDGLLAD